MMDLLSLGKSATEAVSFVTGEAFLNALDAIGGVHMQAARDAFRKVPQSRNPREAMNRALGHLEAAHVAFRGFWSSSVAQYFRMAKCMEQAEKDVNTCCFMALIHRLLGDDEGLVLQAIRLGEEAYAVEKAEGISVLKVAAMIVNPLALLEAVHLDDKDQTAANSKGMSIDQRNEFRRNEVQGFKALILGSRPGQAVDAEAFK